MNQRRTKHTHHSAKPQPHSPHSHAKRIHKKVTRRLAEPRLIFPSMKSQLTRWTKLRTNWRATFAHQQHWSRDPDSLGMEAADEHAAWIISGHLGEFLPALGWVAQATRRLRQWLLPESGRRAEVPEIGGGGDSEVSFSVQWTTGVLENWPSLAS